MPADLALAAAVERLADRFRAEAGLAIDVTIEFDDAIQPGREDQVVLLRCLQETLANVRKHAGANRVSVRVGSAGGATEVEVRDDGRGFDLGAVRAGYGLDGMSERVALAGGTFDIESEPGAGTIVRVRLPLADAAAGGAR